METSETAVRYDIQLDTKKLRYKEITQMEITISVLHLATKMILNNNIKKNA